MEISKVEFDSFCAEMRSFKTEVKEGFASLIQITSDTNARLAETNNRLNETVDGLKSLRIEFNGFRTEVNRKLDGISTFLLSSEEPAQSWPTV